MVKCLCIGDPHFQDSNMKDVYVLVDKIIKYAEKMKPTFIVVLGDILHTHEKISVTPFKTATNFLLKLTEISPTYLLIGNHDYKNNSQFLTDNHAFNSLKQWKNMYVVDNVIMHEYDKCKFIFSPYVPVGRFLEALNQSCLLWEFANAIFAHQELYGCQLGAMKSEIGDVWDADNPLLISGHIHDPQILNDNVIYTGSIMQHGYAEQGKKYLWLFTFDKETHSYEKIDLGLKQKKIINMDIEDVNKFINDESVHIKLDLKGTSEQFKLFRNSKKYKELTTLGVKISFSPIYKDLQEKFGKKELYKNKTFITIFKDLCKDDSSLVKELCEQIVGDVVRNETAPPEELDS